MTDILYMQDTLQDAIVALATLRRAVDKALAQGKWLSASHADGEALGFMAMALANVAGVETLAKSNLHLVIAGTAAGRAAYEAVITCAWMLEPTDLTERDRRWMGLFVEERAYWIRMVKEATTRGDTAAIVDTLIAEVARVDDIIANVTPQFQALNAKPLGKLPSMDDRIQEVGQGRTYVVYKTACQLVHATTRSLATVRDLHTTHKQGGNTASYHYRTRPHDWITAFLLSSESLAFGLETLSGRLLQPAQPLSPDIAALADAVVARTQVMALIPPSS